MPIGSDKTVLVLGGYGNTGRRIASLLVRETGACVVLAGRDRGRAEGLAAEMNAALLHPRVSAAGVDASDRQALDEVVAPADLVVVASSTTAFVEEVATACLHNGCDYLDVQLSTRGKWDVLRRLAPAVEEAGLCFVTDGGYHPGLPAALVARAASDIERLVSANVYACLAMNWDALEFSAATMDEFVEELRNARYRFFADGAWVDGSYRDARTCDFGRWGKKNCIPMHLEEMEALRGRFPSLRETGFFIAGFNPIADYVVMPLTLLGMKVLPKRFHRALASFFTWGLQKTSKPPFGCTLEVHARGTHCGEEVEETIRVFHEDGYDLTAIPVVACLLQVLDGSARRPGLHTQANLVEPRRLMDDLGRMDVEVGSGTGANAY